MYEFGSGSAFNVAAYSRIFPDVPVCALDWAPAAVRIAELLREKHGMKVRGYVSTVIACPYDGKVAPEKVAEVTVKGLRAKRRMVWAPGPLRYVFMVLRHLPGPVWRRLPLG